MRRLPFLLLSVTLPVTTFAQPDSTQFSNPTARGRGLLSGSLSYRHERIGGRDVLLYGRHTVSVSLTRGVFIRDNWLLSGSGSFNGSTLYYPMFPDLVSANAFASLGGSIRRYVGNGRIRGFLGGGVALSRNWNRFEPQNVPGAQPGQRNRVNSFSVRPYTELGALVLVTDRLGVEARTMSEAFPFTFSSFGLGLVVLTGGTRSPGEPVAVSASPTQKGRWLIGAGASVAGNRTDQLDLNDRENSRRLEVNIAPSVGVFVKDNWLLGVRLPFSHTTLRNLDRNNGRSVSTNLTVSPFLRHYVGDTRLRPFVDASLSYGLFRVKTIERTDSPTYGAELSAGLAYLLSDRFIVEATLGRLSARRTDVGQARTWIINASGSLSPGFTLNYVFR